MPEYSGDMREETSFTIELTSCLALGRDKAGQLIELQNKTPADCHLSNVETL